MNDRLSQMNGNILDKGILVKQLPRLNDGHFLHVQESATLHHPPLVKSMPPLIPQYNPPIFIQNRQDPLQVINGIPDTMF